MTPSRLYVGDRVFIGFEPPEASRLRGGPGRHEEVLATLRPGHEMTIIDGPHCDNVYPWWEVAPDSTGLVGWVAEGDEEGTWLIPVE